MSDSNRPRGRSRKGLSVDFKGLRLYDDYGNVEYQHEPLNSSNKEKEVHRGRSGREQSPGRYRVEETDGHHHRKDHRRHNSIHHNVDEDIKHHTRSKNWEHSRHHDRHSTGGDPVVRREQRHGAEVPTERPRYQEYRQPRYDRGPHTLRHKRSVSMGDIPRNVQQRHRHRHHDSEEVMASPARHHHHHYDQEDIDSSSRRHRSHTVHDHPGTTDTSHYHGEEAAASSSRRHYSHRVAEPSHETKAPYDRGERSHRRSESANRDEPRAVYIPVTQTMYDVRAQIAGTGRSIKEVYAAGQYTKDNATMYYHVDLDQWLAYPPAGPSQTREKSRHARHRSIERLVDIGSRVYRKVKEHVEAGSDEFARGWKRSYDNLTDAEKTATRQAEKDERWEEAVRKHEKIARRSSGWDECFGDS